MRNAEPHEKIAHVRAAWFRRVFRPNVSTRTDHPLRVQQPVDTPSLEHSCARDCIGHRYPVVAPKHDFIASSEEGNGRLVRRFVDTFKPVVPYHEKARNGGRYRV